MQEKKKKKAAPPVKGAAPVKAAAQAAATAQAAAPAQAAAAPAGEGRGSPAQDPASLRGLNIIIESLKKSGFQDDSKEVKAIKDAIAKIN